MSEIADFNVDDFNSLLDNLSSQAAPWVSAFSGTAVVPTPTSAAQAALQQTQIQQQAQARLLQTNPQLAGTLASPTVILVIVGGLLVLLFALFFFMRK